MHPRSCKNLQHFISLLGQQAPASFPVGLTREDRNIQLLAVPTSCKSVPDTAALRRKQSVSISKSVALECKSSESNQNRPHHFPPPATLRQDRNQGPEEIKTEMCQQLQLQNKKPTRKEICKICSKQSINRSWNFECLPSHNISQIFNLFHNKRF